MKARIHGVGWVTPLGRDPAAVWQAIQAGATPRPGELTNPFTGRTHPIRRVDPASVADVAGRPRLRRSSVISHFAVAAALDALRDAGCDPANERVALVFAATNGGVIYTRRFFEDVSKTGAHAGSPLLFPETVYNAPASHVAAALGMPGISTTLVNDATVGVEAIAAAVELLESDACDHCLVVAAEEADWVICEAYATWRLTGEAPTIETKRESGAIFGEGSAAVLLGADGNGPEIAELHSGTLFRSIAQARTKLVRIVGNFAGDVPLVISSASETRFDEAERDVAPAARRIAPKAALGECFAASTLAQIVCATLAIRDGTSNALIPVVGFHGQVAALALRG
ncbi:MAG: beta-ketoacyl synthase N-terminal-like domain-containing protein [Terrimicrobiaceae bacterium]|nr:beta-ketoacyl synthase N-terminal-like domain-containing protein [Terrimicrobiaceae bacterium]